MSNIKKTACCDLLILDNKNENTEANMMILKKQLFLCISTAISKHFE